MASAMTWYTQQVVEDIEMIPIFFGFQYQCCGLALEYGSASSIELVLGCIVTSRSEIREIVSL